MQFVGEMLVDSVPFRLSPPTNSDYLASVLLLVYSELIIYLPD